MTQVSDALRENGFVFLPRLLVEKTCDEVVEDFGWKRSSKGGMAHSLRPSQTAPNAPNTYSGRYGFGEFPFHTDLAHVLRPPRYIVLRCVRGFDEVPTRMIDGLNLVEKIGASELARALVQARRPSQEGKPLMAIWEPHVGSGQVRWDEEYLTPASAAGESAMQQMSRELARAAQMSVALSCLGDTLLIDNWRMLHGRAAVAEECRDRVIERVYLESVL